MGLFRQSLALDPVDRMNIWSVLVLLLLALVSWLLPLSPGLLPQARTLPDLRDPGRIELRPTVSMGETRSTTLPRRYEATCWCPAEFTQAHIEYTNAVCASSFNFILQGGNSSHALASLHKIRIGEEETAFRPEMLGNAQKNKDTKAGDKGRPNISVDTYAGTKQKQEKRKQQQQQQQQRIEEANRFFQVTTPFCVFLLAVCLMIPYLVWGLLSSLLGGMNVDQTLVTANEGSRLDHQSRRQLHTELAQAAVETAQSCPWKTSCLYLLLKLLVCAVVLSGAIVVHNSLLPQSRDKRNVFIQEETVNINDINAAPKSMEAGSNTAATSTDTEISSTEENSGITLLCAYKIKQLQNIQTFEMQCLFTPEVVPVSPQPAPKTVTPEPDHLPKEVSPSTTGQVHMMYECLYLILLALLVSLAVINTVNLLVWITKLGCRPCQDSRTSRSQADLPLDGYFLLQMARENAGVDFVRVLAQGDPRRGYKGEEDMELKE